MKIKNFSKKIKEIIINMIKESKDFFINLIPIILLVIIYILIVLIILSFFSDKYYNIKTRRDRISSPSVATLKGHEDLVTSLVLLENGNLASGSYDRYIKIWNTVSFRLVQSILTEHHQIESLVLLKNGYLASGGGLKNIVQIWNTRDWSLIKSLGVNNNIVMTMVVLPNNQDLVIGTVEGEIQIWNLNDEILRHNIVNKKKALFYH